MEAYAGAKYFTTIDLLKGFNQISVEEESIPKLTMTTPWGYYSYKVMPFGIVNGPAGFSRAIFLAMQEFIDDLLISMILPFTRKHSKNICYTFLKF